MQQLRDEERIPFRMSIQKGEELTADFLTVHRTLEPTLCLVARETRQANLAIHGAAREPLAALRRLGVRRLRAERQRD